MHTLFIGDFWIGDNSGAGQFEEQVLVGPDGTVVGFGAEEDVTCQVVQLPGAIQVPGLYDGHTHFLFSLTEGAGSVSGLLDRDELRSFFERRLAEQASGTVVFTDWTDIHFSAEQMQTLVAEVALDREVLVMNVSWHSAVASKALQRRVIEEVAETVRRYNLHGSCVDGLMTEDFVIQTLARLTFDADVLGRALLNRQQLMLSRGITRVYDKLVLGMPLYEMLAQLGETGELFIPTEAAIQPWMMDQGAVPGAHGAFNVVGLKYLFDGALGARTAAMCTERGFTFSDGSVGLLTRPEMRQMMADIDRWRSLGGRDVCVHAIGPGAVIAASDTFDQVIASHLGAGLTLSFEHMELCPPDVTRHVAQLQKRGAAVTVCSQMGFNTDLVDYVDRLSLELLGLINPYRTFAREGLKWRGGTDGPITSDDYFGGMGLAVSRPGPEAISVQEALGACIEGPIAIGRPFTVACLDRDVMRHPSQLAHVQVLQTWINGRKVWERSAS